MIQRNIGKKLSHFTEEEKSEKEDLEDKDTDESELKLESKHHQMLVSQEVPKSFARVAMILKLSSYQKQDSQSDGPTIHPTPEHQHQLALQNDTIVKLRAKLNNHEEDKLDFLHDEIDKFENEMHLDMVQQMNDLHNELHMQACNILPSKVKDLHDRINVQIDQIDDWRTKANLQDKMFAALRDEIKDIRNEMWDSVGKLE